MRPRGIMSRPMFHPWPHAALKSSIDNRLHNLPVRHIPDRHIGAPRPSARSSGTRQIHVGPPDFRISLRPMKQAIDPPHRQPSRQRQQRHRQPHKGKRHHLAPGSLPIRLQSLLRSLSVHLFSGVGAYGPYVTIFVDAGFSP